MKNIVLIFDENGDCQAEANGFKGKACEAELNKLVAALGFAKGKIKKTEYSLEDHVKNSN